MGKSEMDKITKEELKKTPASTQEQSPTTGSGAVNPDWSGFQAYSPMPHGFLASSPQAHPYMWGVQGYSKSFIFHIESSSKSMIVLHFGVALMKPRASRSPHMMPPYGTPPYVAMYPHGGIYAHPSIPPGLYPFSPFAAPSPNGITEASGGVDADVKHLDAKEKSPIKRSKGSLGSLNMIIGKNNELGKMSGATANGVYSKSDESGSEGTTEGSDDDSDTDSQLKTSRGQDSAEAATFQNGSSVHGAKNGGPNGSSTGNQSLVTIPAAGIPGSVTGPTTILNIGMDYWGAPSSSAIPPALKANPVATGSRDQSQHWLQQDEREQKRQRRKQSNRESARRSRLRKQAECDELAERAKALKDENANLRSELNRIRSEHEQLLSANSSLKERLGEVPEKEPTKSNGEKKQTEQSELEKGVSKVG